MKAANMCAVHAKRITIMDKDMALVKWFVNSPVVDLARRD